MKKVIDWYLVQEKLCMVAIVLCLIALPIIIGGAPEKYNRAGKVIWVEDTTVTVQDPANNIWKFTTENEDDFTVGEYIVMQMVSTIPDGVQDDEIIGINDIELPQPIAGYYQTDIS